MQKQWILYGTSGCHLCEQAEGILKQAGFDFESVDICEDSELSSDLFTRYEVNIPVLYDATQQKDILYWPFSLEQVIAYK